MVKQGYINDETLIMNVHHRQQHLSLSIFSPTARGRYKKYKRGLVADVSYTRKKEKKWVRGQW